MPDGATVIFSAHGVSTAVEQEAQRRGLQVFDATCPLVTKVHMEVTRFAREAREVVLIGHAGHPEVEGTMGRFDAAARAGASCWSRTSPTSSGLEVRDPARARLRHADHAVGGRYRGDRRGAARGAFRPCRRRARKTSATPPRTARTRSSNCWSSATCWWSWVRRAARIPIGCASLPIGPRCPGYLVDGAEDLRREWFAGRSTVGRHRRRLGTGTAGAGSGRAAARVGRGAARGVLRPAGARCFCLAARTAVKSAGL